MTRNRMGLLPQERVETGGAFEAVGCDLFGNFYVTRGGRPLHKVWVVIFTCMKSRAVHFEMVYDLSATTFILALQRVAARRGNINRIYSDNGTNFRAADKEIKEAVKEW